MHLTFKNVNDAFKGMVSVFHDEEYVFTAESLNPLYIPVDVAKHPSRNGNTITIEEPVTITYLHPTQRVLFNTHRDANPFFHLYEALWMLAGRNDVAPLALYNSKIKDFSDDGHTFNGAYGYRWRKAKDHVTSDNWAGQDYHIDQIQILINHLKNNPNSRRAVLQMWNVEDDLLKIQETRSIEQRCSQCKGKRYVESGIGDNYTQLTCGICKGMGTTRTKAIEASKDVCCNLSVMFLIREVENKEGYIDAVIESRKPEGTPPTYHSTYKRYLDITVINRSNDTIWGLLGTNYVHFSFLQEYMAAHLGIEVGRYHQITNNAHVYEWNWKPQEWLDYYRAAHVDYDTRRIGQYHSKDSTQKWVERTIPFVHNPEVFDEELHTVVDHFTGGVKQPNDKIATLTEPFFRLVACPMLRAFELHKTYGETIQALRMCEAIEADDWKIACYDWMKKRLQNKEKNEANKHNSITTEN